MSRSEPQDPAPEPPSIDPISQGILGVPLGTSATEGSKAEGRLATTYTVSSLAVARYTLVVVLVLGGVFLLWKVQEVLVLMLLAILVATAIEPLVNLLRRGPFSRGQGILIVYSLIFGILALVGFFFVPSIIDQIGRFIEGLPERIASLRPLIEQIEVRPLRQVLLRAVGEAPPAVQRTLEQPVAAATEPETLVAAGGAVAHTLFSVISVFLLAYYWMTERSVIKRAILRLAPVSKARQINMTWLHVEERLGGWVRGQLMVMAALAMMSGIVFVLLDLPNPLLLAVLAGLFEIVPMIGPFLAFLPALVVALTVDPAKALLLIPIAVVIQQIEGNFLIPRIMSHSVGISPLTVILGILTGSILWGPAGAFLAVPVAAALQVILSDVLRPYHEEETPRTQATTPAAAATDPHEASPAPVPPAQRPKAARV